ncbi:MAG: MCE family protein, partial [Deltaproteobacteria bacterium]
MQTTKIGLLVAIALAILMVTIFSLNQEQPFWERKAQYEVHFSRTGGLQTGAPVSLSGVTIGTVVEMRFPPDPAASYIQVLINVKGDLAPRAGVAAGPARRAHRVDRPDRHRGARRPGRRHRDQHRRGDGVLEGRPGRDPARRGAAGRHAPQPRA